MTVPSSGLGRLREQRLVHVRVERAVRSRSRRAPSFAACRQRRWTSRTPSSSFASSCFSAASSARSRSSSDREQLLHEPLVRARASAPARARSACGSCRTRPRADAGRPGARRRSAAATWARRSSAGRAWLLHLARRVSGPFVASLAEPGTAPCRGQSLGLVAWAVWAAPLRHGDVPAALSLPVWVTRTSSPPRR